MVSRGEDRQVLFRQLKKFNGRPQTPAMFCVRRMLEIFLKMHKSTGGLNQSFEKITVVGVAFEPKLFQDIVCFVVTLLIPATKERAIKRMIRHVAGSPRRVRPVAEKIDIVAFELAHKARNPLAFAHEGLNFIVPQMMGKLTFPEGHENVRDRSQE